VARDRTTRPVVACCLGDRREESGRFLWEPVPAPWRKATGYTDCWEAYRAVIPDAQQVAGGKVTGKRRMGSGGTTPCARDWDRLYAKPSRSRNGTTCMMRGWFCSYIAITSVVDDRMLSHYPFSEERVTMKAAASAALAADLKNIVKEYPETFSLQGDKRVPFDHRLKKMLQFRPLAID
jgi:hypothetical protein